MSFGGKPFGKSSAGFGSFGGSLGTTTTSQPSAVSDFGIDVQSTSNSAPAHHATIAPHADNPPTFSVPSSSPKPRPLFGMPAPRLSPDARVAERKPTPLFPSSIDGPPAGLFGRPAQKSSPFNTSTLPPPSSSAAKAGNPLSPTLISAAHRRSTGEASASRLAVRRALNVVRSNQRVANGAAPGRRSPPTIKSGRQPVLRAHRATAVRPATVKQSDDIANKLRALVGRRCESTFDKYQLLEERDKLLYEVRRRHAMQDVRKATVTHGCCPDMCPEKERYKRQVQKSLSQYEMSGERDANGDQICEHTKAVKNYTRSAADQEEPLAHELRDARVLQSSMHYLLTYIGDRLPPVSDASGRAMWYDFLWKRTRAIRKDVTMQMLHSWRAVDLVESCARLHLYAAYTLCEMDLGSFAPQMNTENLNKSLQTLRHMYDDSYREKSADHATESTVDDALNYIGSAQQVIDDQTEGDQHSTAVCRNEAEFRAYDVLLNMQDSKCLKQVLTYSPSVRQSPAVRFAVRVLTCVQNNNYVRFFRMIDGRASFLQICAVHRHLGWIRRRALAAIIRGHSSNAPLPLPYVARMLGYKNETQCAEFVSFYGVTCDGSMLNVGDLATEAFDEMGVPAIAKADIDPMTHLRDFERSPTSVDGVCVSSLLAGRIVHAPRLPPPVVSFDVDGRYMAVDPVLQAYLHGDDTTLNNNRTTPDDPHATEDELHADGRSGVDGEFVPQEPTSNRQQMILIVKAMHREIGGPMIGQILPSIVRPVLEEALADAMTDRCVDEVLRDSAIAPNVETAFRAAKAESYTALCDDVWREITADATRTIVDEECARAIRRVRDEERSTAMREVAETMTAEVVDCFVQWAVVGIAEHVFATHVTYVCERVASIARRLRELRALQLVRSTWLRRVRERRRKEKIFQQLIEFKPTTTVHDVVASRRSSWPPKQSALLSLSRYSQNIRLDRLARLSNNRRLDCLRRLFGRWRRNAQNADDFRRNAERSAVRFDEGEEEERLNQSQMLLREAADVQQRNVLQATLEMSENIHLTDDTCEIVGRRHTIHKRASTTSLADASNDNDAKRQRLEQMLKNAAQQMSNLQYSQHKSLKEVDVNASR